MKVAIGQDSHRIDMEQIYTKAKAKINLTLEVLDRRKDKIY